MKKVFNPLVVISTLLLLVPVVLAAPLAQQECAQDYIVQKNDSLSKLADKYLGDVTAYQTIADATNAKNKEDSSYATIDDVDLIEPGWRLCIPPTAAAPAVPAAAPSGERVKVLLSMKERNPFWAAVEQGATEAAAALGNVELTVLAPPAETDVATQVSQIEEQIAQGVQAICVAPTDATDLNPTFERAYTAGIPVLYVETEGQWPYARTFIGTDDRAGGVMAGEFICRRLGAGSDDKVALIVDDMSNPAHSERINNARDAMLACELKVLFEQSAYGEFDRGKSVMEGILRIHKGDVDAVFASNDEMALGAQEALKEAGRTDVPVVGFGASDEARASIEKGELVASVAPDPYNMGELCVKNAVKAARGENIAPRIDSGSEMVTGAGAVPAECVPQEGKAVLMVINTGHSELTFDISTQTKIVPGADTVPEGGRVCFQLDPGRHSYSISRADGQGNRGDLSLEAGDLLQLSY
jgi:ribose transport system substrate-binding protein